MDDFASKLRGGDPVVGTWLGIGHPAVAEIVATAAPDFVVIDTEHTPAGLETVENVLRAVEAAEGDTTPLARVAWNDPVRIKRLLDTGPAGLVVPMVENAEEARAAVEAMRYPPEGVRGIAASRATNYTANFPGYVDQANDELVTVVQIESGTAVENAESIAGVEGVDALFVGPSDLSSSLAAFPDADDQRVVEAVQAVAAAGDAAGVPVGTLSVDPGRVAEWLDRGMDFLVVGFDAAFLADGADEAVAAFEDALER
jgi:2-keto-3-deoxy-L-rhamnonate aldolase RhmA